MKKIFGLVLTVVMAVTMASCAQKKKLVVGLDENFPPMGFRENGVLTGFDIEMAAEAGKRMGVEMEFQPIDWGSKEMELSSKRVDLLWNGFTITDKRKETILFTKPYLKNKQVIMVMGNSGITIKADLSGKIIGLQKESSAVDAVDADEVTKASFAEIVEYQDNIMAFTDLAIGRIDAVVVDEIVAKYYLAQNKTDIILLSDDFGDEEYGVGMRMEDTKLNKKLQDALDSMYKDGTAAEISKKWFGEDIVLK